MSTDKTIKRIAVLVVCFNRRALTLIALENLYRQTGIEDVTVDVYLVDDGSSDGTGEAVHTHFPSVQVTTADGSLYWVGGMRLAFELASKKPYDAYLWFNDDTVVDPDAISRLIACEDTVMKEMGSSIVVGSFKHPQTGAHTYGGLRKRASGFKLNLDPVPPDENTAVRCDTLNGNLVLLPAAVAEKLGNMDAAYTQKFADFDYGFRATAHGIAVVVAPGYFGTCMDNPGAATWKKSNLSLGQRWKAICSRKGLPPAEWFVYTRRHFGWRWPMYAVSPYLKALFNLG